MNAIFFSTNEKFNGSSPDWQEINRYNEYSLSIFNYL